jgi:hypothetical protein
MRGPVLHNLRSEENTRIQIPASRKRRGAAYILLKPWFAYDKIKLRFPNGKKDYTN